MERADFLGIQNGFFLFQMKIKPINCLLHYSRPQIRIGTWGRELAKYCQQRLAVAPYMFTDHVHHKQSAIIRELCVATEFAYYPVQKEFIALERV